MTSRHPDPWREPAARILPLDLTAFFSQYHKAYLRYAHLQLDDRSEAEDVVEEVFAELAVNWSEALQQPSVEAFALATLKEVIAERLAARDRTVPFVATAAFAAVREATRSRLETLESRLGLYAAIARLPERHYDVIVLHFVLGYPMKQVAHIMGVSYGTVRSHVRGARRSLGRDLGIHWAPKEEESHR